VILIASAGLTVGCNALAIGAAPDKAPSAERTPAAVQADGLFWATLHGGQYERIPEALTALTGAYLDNPNDAVTAAHIGWMHIWRLSERARLEPARDPTITDHAVLARKYFEEAVHLNPREARYLGFYAALLMTEGAIHRDEKLRRRGYYTMRDAIAAWPEFNYFTAGYGLSSLRHDSERFAEGLQFQWLTLDACVGEKVDRANADFSRYMRLETKDGPKRVCWNSWIAPHNFEGFFLNFGDMLVKSGQPQTAVKMYANARHAPEYDAWPYKNVLEDRIRNAAANVEAFRQEHPEVGVPTIMVRSPFACMGCTSSEPQRPPLGAASSGASHPF
jgi:hypothetical protein